MYNNFLINTSVAALKNNNHLDMLLDFCVFPLILFSEIISVFTSCFIDNYTCRFHQVVYVQWVIIIIVGNIQHKCLITYFFH